MNAHPTPQRRMLSAAAPLAVLALFGAALWQVNHHLAEVSRPQLLADLEALGWWQVAAAAVLSAASYALMTGYDALALRYVGHRLPYRRYGAASFAATAFGNTLGASAVVGAALRARVYSAWGVPGPAITRLIGFNLVTLVLGAIAVAGLGQFVGAPGSAWFGVLALSAVGTYLLWARRGPAQAAMPGQTVGGEAAETEPTKGLRRWFGVTRPGLPLASAQVALSGVEWFVMALGLYVLLPDSVQLNPLAFAGIFTLATMAGLVSNVPGGLGVFEVALFTLMGSHASPGDLAAALVIYRIVFYLLPLMAAGLVLAGLEFGLQNRPRTQRRLGLGELTPPVVALLAIVLGTLLFLRDELLGRVGLGLSAFTTSLAGLALMVLAWGLYRRFHGSWAVAVTVCFGASVMAALGGQLPTALLIAGFTVVLGLTRPAFHRTRKAPQSRRIPVLAMLLGLAGIAAVWWCDVRPVDGTLEGHSWWAAVLSGQMPGWARAATAAGLIVAAAAAARLVIPQRARFQAACAEELERASEVVSRAGSCTSHLLFTGDKRVLFSARGDAFIMYQIEGRSWVSMGDPVGDPIQFPELVHSFVNLADRHAGRPVFYSVGDEVAALYREHGLSMVKLGEEAYVPLEGFTMGGRSKAGLRWKRNSCIKLGCEVQFVSPDEVGDLIDELQGVSDAWLGEKAGGEKCFSLGAFDADYVRRFPVAVVRLEGRIIAFASLWTSADGREVQVDLMRRVPDSPLAIMNYLFVECMVWSQERGFDTFVLGMAPLSGLRADAGAPLWERVGHLLWTHGERFYNFKGVRSFKENFDPQWRTRYVAAPGGSSLPTAMVNVATLVGGGVRSMIRR